MPPKYRHWIARLLRAGATALPAALMISAHAMTFAHAAVPATPPADAVADPVSDVAQLTSLAQAEAALHLPPLTAKQRFLVGPIPQHVQLAACSGAIKPSVAMTPHMNDRVLVELRCQGSSAWHMYVPVRIVGTASAVVAAHAIVNGSVLTANDLIIEQRDVITLPPGYLDDPAIAVGLTASRAISGGAVLTNQHLMGMKAVHRGQSVTLVADAGGMSIRMAGRAMSDGLVNQRVRVENLSSGKIVEGIARSEQVVEIIVQ
jgi:flagellar basal body P-ring formation protein FlgA